MLNLTYCLLTVYNKNYQDNFQSTKLSFTLLCSLDSLPFHIAKIVGGGGLVCSDQNIPYYSVLPL